MSIYAGPEIADSGLVICLDAANANSYASPGTASIQFASSSRIRLPTTTALQFGSGDFTIEFWMQAGGTQTTFATIVDASTNNQAICVGVGTNLGGIAGRLSFSVFGGTGTLNSTTPVLDNTWRHIACVKSGATGRLFVNGVLEASTADWATVSNAFVSGGCLGGSAFGGGTANDNWFAGNIANFAVYNTAVYTTNFTVPTQPPTVSTGLQLLYNATSASAYLVDSSVNNFVSTVGSGTPVWNGRTPFTRSSWLDISGQRNNATLTNSPNYTLANSGSIIFNGTNNFANFGNILANLTSLTLECWINFGTQTSNFNGIISKTESNSSGYELRTTTFAAGTTIAEFRYNGDLAASGTFTFTNGLWYHVVGVGTPGFQGLYVNGALVASNTVNTVPTVNASDLVVGKLGYAGLFVNANISVAKIYNVALTADQVNQNFQALRGRYGI